MKRNQLRHAVFTSAAALCLAAAQCLAAAPAFAQAGDTTAQDKKFVMKSAQGNMAEVQMGKLALKKSKNDTVRDFAQKMVDDHSKLMTDMQPYCDKMHAMPPSHLSKEQQMTVHKLSAKSGKAFDTAYVKAMVADHHNDLAEFKQEAATTSNQDLKTTVTSGQQVIQMHSDMIDGIAQKMNIPTSSM